MINWTHVIGTHAPHIMILGLAVLLAQIVHQVVSNLSKSVEHTASPGELVFSLETLAAVGLAIKDLVFSLFHFVGESHGLSLLSPAIKTTALVLIVGAWIMRMDNPIYLLSFATFKAPDSWQCSHTDIVEMMRRQACFTDDSLKFMERILERSGTGQATAWPPGITQCLKTNGKADRSMNASREEASAVLFNIVEQALRKAHVKPKEIDVLVINCSLFSPTPSLCALVASHFGMRSDIATYNLAGMGCSASLISIDLAKKLLQNRKGGKALVVSTEIITPNLYHGNDRAYLIQNTLFRCGGAAMVLSNSWLDGRRAWYKLLHTVRVQGTDDDSYNAVFETEDDEGERGVRLSKEIVKVAGKCMEKNMTMLGPLVLPLTEQVKVVATIVARFILKKLGRTLKEYGKEDLAMKLPSVRPYVPDFKLGIDHFCIHAGGRAVIDGEYIQCTNAVCT
jgi:3-ketoacyl-CoA synthase